MKIMIMNNVVVQEEDGARIHVNVHSCINSSRTLSFAGKLSNGSCERQLKQGKDAHVQRKLSMAHLCEKISTTSIIFSYLESSLVLSCVRKLFVSVKLCPWPFCTPLST